VVSGTASHPKSMPAERRRLALSYRVSSHAKSARVNQCCRKTCAACAPVRSAGAHCSSSGNTAQRPRTVRPRE
jgi:hypothetical protein